MDIANLPIRQRPQILPDYGGSWMVRDTLNGREAPFGPVGVSREEAQAWLADPVRVTIVGTLQDHHPSYTSYDDYGNRPCICGEKNIGSWERHQADMISDRLNAAGLT
jgi:hypothetical protein